MIERIAARLEETRWMTPRTTWLRTNGEDVQPQNVGGPHGKARDSTATLC